MQIKEKQIQTTRLLRKSSKYSTRGSCTSHRTNRARACPLRQQQITNLCRTVRDVCKAEGGMKIWSEICRAQPRRTKTQSYPAATLRNICKTSVQAPIQTRISIIRSNTNPITTFIIILTLMWNSLTRWLTSKETMVNTFNNLRQKRRLPWAVT